MSTINERAQILTLLLEITEKGRFVHLVLADFFKDHQDLAPASRAFIHRVVEGTLERLITIDYVIDAYAKTKVAKMKPVVRTVLRMSVYQMLFMDQVPDFAICNEAVKLARKKGFASLSGFINGILRTIARHKGELPMPTDATEALSVRYALPLWLVQIWSQTYSLETIEQMGAAFLEHDGITIRVNLLRTNPDLLMKQLQDAGVEVERHPALSYALILHKPGPLAKLPGYDQGAFYVQDLSSMMVTHLAELNAGEVVLDVCAAPGGKSLHAAATLAQLEAETRLTGVVYARDLTAAKVALIEENRARMQLNNLHTKVWDARILDESMVAKVDVVYADVPCSGLGILRKKPDLKYQASLDGIESLQALQRQIIDCAVQYVKPGGTLMYSTCTINTLENDAQVAYILNKYPELSLVPLSEQGALQLLPGVNHCDGFFIAKFVKML